MVSFSNQQLQSAIAQLDQAIYSHDHWYKNLLRVMIARIPPEEADLVENAHHRCRFGQWYESTQATHVKKNPAFVSLGEAHERMHQAARILFQRVSDGLPIPMSHWDMFDNSLDRMRLEFQALRQEFAEMAQNRDPLTEAQTRATLLPELREQHALVVRGRQDCALVMLDLDHFKRINDDFGHAAGDAVLISTVRCLKAHLRPYDRIYRYGGEEFVVCLPSTTLDEARQASERMHSAIAAQRVKFGKVKEPLKVTASFGVVVLTAHESVEASIDRADKAMYEAKAAGRNCIVVEPIPNSV